MTNFFFGNMEKELIEHLNEKHPTIKFTAEWSQTSINLYSWILQFHLQVEIFLQILYVKPTDSHQYFHSSSCHLHHCKYGIRYNQALCLYSIFSDPNSFVTRYYDLEKWLIKIGFSERGVCKQISRVRSFSRYCLLDRENTRGEQNKITFNLSY